MEDQRAIESKEIILRSSGKNECLGRHTKISGINLIRGKLAAFWNAQRSERWTDSGRGAPALSLTGFPHAGLGKLQLFPRSCQCSLYFLEPWSTTSCCHSSPDLTCVLSTQPDCHISSFLCHIGHYPLPTSYITHTVILEQYNSIYPSYTIQLLSYLLLLHIS